MPQGLARQGNGIGEGGLGLVIPGSLPDRDGFPGAQPAGCQCHPGEQSQEQWRSAGNGLIRPLAPGFQTRAGPSLLESGLQLPAQRKPLNNAGCGHTGSGAQQCLGLEPGQGVPDQDPPQGDRRQAGMIPDGGS